MGVILAIEGGATRMSAGCYDETGALLEEREGGPCNPSAYGLGHATAAIVALARGLASRPAQIVAGVSGAFEQSQREQLAQALLEAAGAGRVRVATDLHPLLHANAQGRPAHLAVAGTGAAVLSTDGAMAFFRTGGRGTVLGDDGSAYWIAVSALRAAARAVDGMAPTTCLVETLPQALGLDTFDQLASWAAAADKAEVARLAAIVDAEALKGDDVARGCIEEQARRLASVVLAAHHRAQMPEDAPVFLNGSVFEKSHLFHEGFRQSLSAYTELQARWPGIGGHHAVHALAALAEVPDWMAQCERNAASGPAPISATEARDRSARPLDQMDAIEIVRHMAEQDAALAGTVARAAGTIAETVEAAARSLRHGGRLIYAGAGTSGRLGVLDASECPPTFGVPADKVVGLIAGGDGALRESVEGAEDDTEQGKADIAQLGVGKADTVVGIAASGGTPYVLGALDAARRRGAVAVLLCCNPAARGDVDHLIALDTGPEVLPGSTRLKAGTATKMVLNMISTGAMARAGYIYDGLMVGVRPVNRKLRQRCIRIVAELLSLEPEGAEKLLDAAGGSIACAVLMRRKDVGREGAEALLGAAKGVLHDALD